MHNILHLILLLVLLVVTTDSISNHPSSLINADTKELYRLIKKLWSVSPIELKRANKRMCQILLQCCSPKAYSKVLLGTISAANNTSDPFIEARAVCMSSPIRNNTVKSCPPAISLNASFSLPSKVTSDIHMYNKYHSIVEESIKLVPVLGNFHTHMAHVCNAKEIYTYLCATNYRHSTSCMKKILKKYFNTHNKKTYQIYVKNLKRLITYMYQIMHEFA